MTEIAISISRPNDRRSLTTRIRVSVRAPDAGERMVLRSVDSQLGVGPLLPDNSALIHGFDALNIEVDTESGR